MDFGVAGIAISMVCEVTGRKRMGRLTGSSLDSAVAAFGGGSHAVQLLLDYTPGVRAGLWLVSLSLLAKVVGIDLPSGY